MTNDQLHLIALIILSRKAAIYDNTPHPELFQNFSVI